ncbi:MAG: glycosyltransferase family 2 protein [Anaerolinea sp.]|nr:glycosyltransferase family 2 protein [Anaerolinea sp.]
MDLSIIIVSWNTRELLAACLSSLRAYPPEGFTYETWVVDNASSDGSAAMVRQEFLEVHLLESGGNLGFAGGNNLAIAQSDGRYLLLLNPDTELLPGALTALLTFMERHAEAGGAGSRLLNPDHTLQPSCHPLPTLTGEFWRLLHLDLLLPHGVYKMHRWDTAVPRQVDIVQGASFILRRSVLEKVGLLDDSYFMYSEEVDLCYRIKRAGWPLYWVPESQVIHYGGQSTRQAAAQMFVELYRGKVQYFRKNQGAVVAAVYKAILFLAALPRLPLLVVGHLLPGERGKACVRLGKHYGRLLRALPKL